MAGMPAKLRNSIVVETFHPISDWVMSLSSPDGQGTATSKKQMGKQKCFNHGQPPICQSRPRVIPTTSMAMSQLANRHIGLASWTSRVGRSRKARTSSKTTDPRETASERATGRLRHFFQKRYQQRKGTLQP